MKSHTPPPFTLVEQAADWLARNDTGLDAGEQAAFQEWLESSPAHRAAWEEVSAPWVGLDQARADGFAPEMLAELARRQQRRKWSRRKIWIGLAAAAAVAVSLTAGLYRNAAQLVTAPVQPTVAAVESVPVGESRTRLVTTPSVLVLQPEQRQLDDGTVVELSERALLSVNFTPERREVRLISGTAHFTVAHNPDRPFIVQTGAVAVRAVGTAFAVERSDTAADVLVTEGRVGVARTVDGISADEPLLVPAGGRLLMSYQPGDTPVVEMLNPEEMARRLQWRAPRLQLHGAALPEVVTLLNRFNHTQMTIADPTLEQLRFSGVFRADNAAGFVRMLESDHRVAITYNGENTIVLRRR
jgi:transmembrane sensor